MTWGCKLIDTNKVTQQRHVLLIMMRSCLMILLIKPIWKFCNEVEAVAFLFNQQITYKHSLKLFPLQFQWWPIDQGTIDSYVVSWQYSPIIFYTNTSTLTSLFLHSEGSLMVKILQHTQYMNNCIVNIQFRMFWLWSTKINDIKF